jgi:hypothetical protein
MEQVWPKHVSTETRNQIQSHDFTPPIPSSWSAGPRLCRRRRCSPWRTLLLWSVEDAAATVVCGGCCRHRSLTLSPLCSAGRRHACSASCRRDLGRIHAVLKLLGWSHGALDPCALAMSTSSPQLWQVRPGLCRGTWLTLSVATRMVEETAAPCLDYSVGPRRGRSREKGGDGPGRRPSM